jgi:hypothetical protein
MKVFNKNTQPAQNTGQVTGHEPMSKRTKLILFSILVLVIGLIAGIILVQQRQTPEKRASEPGPSCPLDAFRCTWEKEEGVTYECIIHKVTTDGTVEVARPVVKEDPETGKGLCTYTPEPNTQYSCTVNATLFPGCESSDTATALCPVNTPTPTLTPTITPTSTPTPTPNPKCYITECNPDVENDCETLGLPEHSCTDTNPSSSEEDFRCILNDKCVDAPEDNPEACWCFAPTPTATMTPTPTLTPTITPTSTPRPTGTITPPPGATNTPGPTNTPPPGATLTPTDIVVVQVTSTPPPTGTTTVITQNNPTSTPVPTLPVAGVPQATYLILLVGMLVVIIGLAL